MGAGTELADLKKAFIPADKGRRFVNYIIDFILANIYASIIMWMIFVFIDLITGDWGFGTPIFIRWPIRIVILASYFFVLEYYSHGKTIGKLITNTKVVSRHGHEPVPAKLLGRSFARFIPFEPFSVLFSTNGLGWHDTLSGTVVIEDR